jgi:hypothetical protein
MSSRTLLHAAFAAAVALTALAPAQGIPQVANPSTSTPSGPVSPPKPDNTARVGNAMSGSMYYSSGTKTTQDFTGVSCMAVTPQACGGQFSVNKGAEFSLYGVSITMGMDWAANEQDGCRLCQVYLCMNSKGTETKRKGKTWYESGTGQAGPKHDYDTTSKVMIPDPSTATLKLECNDSKEAREYCCPTNDKGFQGGYVEEPIDAELISVHTDQFAFGGAFSTPSTLTLADVAGVVQVDLRTVPLVQGQRWEPAAEVPREWRYCAHMAAKVSLAQRVQIGEQINQAFDLGVPGAPVPSGHVLVALTQDGGTSRVIDLGTVYDIVLYDTLRLTQPADVDMNGIVNGADLDIVLEDLTQPATEARGDVNLDGWVTNQDVELVLAAM